MGKRLRNDLFCVEWDIKPQINKVLKIPIHVLHPLLPTPSVIHSDMVYDPEYTTKLYQRKTSNLGDCNFIIRMLYVNAY